MGNTRASDSVNGQQVWLSRFCFSTPPSFGEREGQHKQTITMKKLLFLLCVLLSVTAVPLTSCSSDDPDTSTPSTNPTKPVADPEGTVTVNLLSGGGGVWLGKSPLSIDNGMNFIADNGPIVDVGEVAGLGNVVLIPESGWSTKALVTPGHGYMLRYNDGYKFTYYRVYVVEYLKSTTGALIGAQIKYQAPYVPTN